MDNVDIMTGYNEVCIEKNDITLLSNQEKGNTFAILKHNDIQRLGLYYISLT